MRTPLSEIVAPPTRPDTFLNRLLVKPSGLIAPALWGRGDIPHLPFPFDGELRSELRSLGRIGELEVLLATRREIKRAQKLRYKVFYKHGNAIADAATMLSRRDRDRFDKICDHLIVVDHAGQSGRKPKVVGACRLLRQSVAEACDGFYSAGEFDLARVIERHSHLKFLELGRFCVLPSHRSKRTAELLWQGIWRYVRHHRADVLIGCGSLEGTDPMLLAPQLSYLHHFGRAPDGWQSRALGLSIRTDWLAKDAVDVAEARRALPPLIKAYLRLGAFIGNGAVIDHQFGTTDVLIMLPIAAIGERYIKHFSPNAADTMPVLVELAS